MRENPNRLVKSMPLCDVLQNILSSCRLAAIIAFGADKPAIVWAGKLEDYMVRRIHQRLRQWTRAGISVDRCAKR
jgi:hypothetical protein